MVQPVLNSRMVKMRRQDSSGEQKADFITSAVRRKHGLKNSGDQERKKIRVEEVENSLKSEGSEEHISIGTPLIGPLGKSVAADTISTDDSTGTSEELDHQLRKSDGERPSSSITVTQNSSKIVTYSESSEVFVSQEVSCARTTIAAVPDMNDMDDEEFAEVEFDPYAFIKTLPPLNECVPARNTFLLPRLTRHSMRKKTLVLDLDETLVHSTLDGTSDFSDFVFPVSLGNVTHMVAVRKRPHLHTFLARMARIFEIVVFTASQKIYAEQLLDIVDPQGEYIRHRIYRDSCVVWEGNYLKDLTVLGRDLAHTIIVDNSPQAFGFQLENGVPIESWYDDDNDIELLRLIPFLEQLAHVDDVRPHLGNKFGLKDLVEAAPDMTYLD